MKPSLLSDFKILTNKHLDVMSELYPENELVYIELCEILKRHYPKNKSGSACPNCDMGDSGGSGLGEGYHDNTCIYWEIIHMKRKIK